MDTPQQSYFEFGTGRGDFGYRRWQEQRRETMSQLAQKMGMPLGRRVEVWLRGEIRLVGVLRLREELLFVPEERESHLELTVDGVPFTPGEMVSCVALD